MIIKKLGILSFGKFQEKNITLHDGLNLIYGGNEDGKTTLHKFIEGMFYGFYKPYSKNKYYTSDYEKFVPWSGSEYKGIIEYDKDGKIYRLERNFNRINESVKLYNNTTGDDLTASLEYDSAQKLYKANKHIDINSTLFKNTVSIGQLDNVTDEDLTKEIGDLLINTSDTFNAQISFKTAIENLARERSNIGTKKQLKSPYGICVSKLQELEEEKRLTRSVIEENKSKYSEIRNLENQLRNASQLKGGMQEMRERIRLKKMMAKYQRYTALQEEIEELQKKLDKKINITDADYDAYNEACAKYEITLNKVKETEVRKAQVSEKLFGLNKEISQYRQSKKETSLDEYMQDSALLAQRLKKLEELKNKKTNDEDPSIHKKFVRLKKFEKIFSTIGTIFVFLTIGAAAAGFFKDPKYYYFAGGFAAGAVLFLALWAVMSTKSANLEPYYERYDTIMSRTSNMIVMCDLDITQLKQKYQCKETDDLIDLLEHAQSNNSKIQEYEKQIEICNDTLAALKAERDHLENSMNEYQTAMKRILDTAGVPSADMLKDAVSAAREQKVIRAKLESAFSSVQDILGDMTPEALEMEAQNALQQGITPQNHFEETSDDDIENANDAILSITSKIASLRGSVTETENSIRALNEIDEEIASTQTKIDQYEEDLNAYDLAIEKIEQISKDIHGDFAQDFNSYVSDIIKQITKGKYSDVKVNDKMEIKVVDHAQGRLTDVNSLSGGTIDQLYFAVRFAVMDLIIKEKSIPVFLDDCFLQYDDARLENILKIIGEKAKQRQILLFTCRNAEKEALTKNNIPFHYIEL